MLRILVQTPEELYPYTEDKLEIGHYIVWNPALN